MSIINDALKKANQDRGLRGSPMLKTVSDKKKSVNWGPIFVLLVAGVIISPLAAPFFSNPFRQAVYNTGLTATENRKAQFGVEEMAMARPIPMAALSPSFNLSGIVFSLKGDDSYCIINNQVLKKGDKIAGAKLIKVTPEEAVLEYNGRQITLSN